MSSLPSREETPTPRALFAETLQRRLLLGKGVRPNLSDLVDGRSEAMIRRKRVRRKCIPLQYHHQWRVNGPARRLRESPVLVDWGLIKSIRSSAPSSPNSLESAPMDESDSDDEISRSKGIEDEGVMYPVDGLYRSEAEKAEVMAMRDLEREQIIAERQQEVGRLRQNRLLRQMVVDSEKAAKKTKKKRSADADLDDGSRKTRSRPGKGESAMELLRRSKAEKLKRKEDHERRRDNFSPGRGYSDDEESDYEYGRRRSRTPEKEEAKDAPPAELKDYDRVRLGRNEFAQVCFTPGFEPSITGCFIRVALGPHPETGVEQYRMAMIKGKMTCLILYLLHLLTWRRIHNGTSICSYWP